MGNKLNGDFSKISRVWMLQYSQAHLMRLIHIPFFLKSHKIQPIFQWLIWQMHFSEMLPRLIDTQPKLTYSWQTDLDWRSSNSIRWHETCFSTTCYCWPTRCSWTFQSDCWWEKLIHDFCPPARAWGKMRPVASFSAKFEPVAVAVPHCLQVVAAEKAVLASRDIVLFWFNHSFIRKGSFIVIVWSKL